MDTSPDATDGRPDLIRSAEIVFRNNKKWADEAIAQVRDEDLRVALCPDTNSIAVIMKHVAGNLKSRWTDFLTSDGEKPWRDRDSEFVDDFTSREEIETYWESGWACLLETLASIGAGDLSRTVAIRGEPHSVSLALQRSLGHTTYHVGQIVLQSRVLCREEWKTITIPRGESAAFNQRVWSGDSFSRRAEDES